MEHGSKHLNGTEDPNQYIHEYPLISGALAGLGKHFYTNIKQMNSLKS